VIAPWSRSTHSREALLSLLQSLLRLGVPDGVNVTGASSGGLYTYFILVAIVDRPKRHSPPLSVNSTHRARIPGDGEAFAGISRTSGAAFSRGCGEFQGTQTNQQRG
jgi:hypothetical protein